MNREETVGVFHDAFGVIGIKEESSPEEVINLMLLRGRLINEEFDEVAHEIDTIVRELSKQDGHRDMKALTGATYNLAKELADLQYVLSGFAELIGLDLEEAFQRVHASNMSKLGDDGRPIYREDGKVLKGPNYQPPDMEGVWLYD